MGGLHHYVFIEQAHGSMLALNISIDAADVILTECGLHRECNPLSGESGNRAVGALPTISTQPKAHESVVSGLDVVPSVLHRRGPSQILI